LPAGGQAAAWWRNQAEGLPWTTIAGALLAGIDQGPISVLPVVALGAAFTQVLRPSLGPGWTAWLWGWPLRLAAIVVFAGGVLHTYLLQYAMTAVALHSVVGVVLHARAGAPRPKHE
jgi:hypothetical protein